jgi:hypothetical protein
VREHKEKGQKKESYEKQITKENVGNKDACKENENKKTDKNRWKEACK